MSLRVRVASLALMGALAVALGAAACGGGDDGLSRAEYIAQADAICKRSQRRLEDLGQADSVNRFVQLTERAIPILRKQFRDIDALEPPEEIAAQVHEWHEVNTRGVEELEDLPQAVRVRDRARSEALLRRAARHEERAAALARRIGFKVCGRRS